MTESPHLQDLPTAFGALKPVGHVLLAVPSGTQLSVLQTALQRDGDGERTAVEFQPHDAVTELATMIDNASGAAGFGYELALMRRYLQLARAGHRWLLVKVEGTDEAARVGQLARLYGASSVVHYRSLTVEELL